MRTYTDLEFAKATSIMWNMDDWVLYDHLGYGNLRSVTDPRGTRTYHHRTRLIGFRINLQESIGGRSILDKILQYENTSCR